MNEKEFYDLYDDADYLVIDSIEDFELELKLSSMENPKYVMVDSQLCIKKVIK